jgi:D-alanyl-lipoteichoic acid acyltransferase DltB (MBOAT superfamily)
MGIKIEKSHENKKKVLIASIAINVLILVFFKYIHSFAFQFWDNSNTNESPLITKIILPVGLSYMVFTLLSYIIEVKRGNINSEKHFGLFLTSMLFFPKIMQGPIERPQKLLPQFREAKSFDPVRLVEGLKLIIWGLFKKLVIADRLAIYVNAVYGNVEFHNGTTLAVATIFYAFQLYADFSAYIDIALGSSKILGFDLTNNFKRPYFAKSVKEFWDRWHITFSLWLRDYLFLPLAFYLSRKLKDETFLKLKTEKWIYLFSIMITFAICGLWHGEGLNFLLWGLLFGVFLTWSNWMEKPFKSLRKKFNIKRQFKVYIVFKVLSTFLLVSFAWIFFRANSTAEAFEILGRILKFKGPIFIDSQHMAYGLFGILILLVIEYGLEYHYGKFKKSKWIFQQIAYACLIIITLMIGVFDGGQFIYFQF